MFCGKTPLMQLPSARIARSVFVLEDNIVSFEVFERGNLFGNLYLCPLVDQADTVCIFIKGVVFLSPRGSGYWRGCL